MFDLVTFIGLAASVLTTASYVPQLRKSWASGSTADLSLRMILTLASGLSLWVAYGWLRADAVIVLANTFSLALLLTILALKLRGRRAADEPKP